ncbi:MAG: hypothetical protein ABII00_14285 [Elusimicrobiota bacterium]
MNTTLEMRMPGTMGLSAKTAGQVGYDARFEVTASERIQTLAMLLTEIDEALRRK